MCIPAVKHAEQAPQTQPSCRCTNSAVAVYVGVALGGQLAHHFFLPELTTQGLRGAGFLNPITRRRACCYYWLFSWQTDDADRIFFAAMLANAASNSSDPAQRPWRREVFSRAATWSNSTKLIQRKIRAQAPRIFRPQQKKFHWRPMAKENSHQKLTKTLTAGVLGVPKCSQ